MDKKKIDTLFTIVLIISLILIVVFKFTLGKPKAQDLSFIYDIPTYQGFTQDKVPDTDISRIVRAGINAPSGMNKQPWFFAVVDDAEPAQDRDLRGGKPHAVRLQQRVLHVVDELTQPVVELFDRSGLFAQRGMSRGNDLSECHDDSPNRRD